MHRPLCGHITIGREDSGHEVRQGSMDALALEDRKLLSANCHARHVNASVIELRHV